jgi:LemA protein
MNKKFIIVVILIAVLGMSVVLTYNMCVTAEKAVEESKAQVAAACQRRLDLIPNLVETVRGYAAHEQNTLLAVTQARTRAQESLQQLSQKKSATSKDMGQMSEAMNSLTAGVQSLLVVVEKYPDLKANENFSALQDQLEGTENRINVARQRYNTDVRVYNTKIRRFPAVVFTSILGFSEKPYFEAAPKAAEAVPVKF